MVPGRGVVVTTGIGCGAIMLAGGNTTLLLGDIVGCVTGCEANCGTMPNFDLVCFLWGLNQRNISEGLRMIHKQRKQENLGEVVRSIIFVELLLLLLLLLLLELLVCWLSSRLWFCSFLFEEELDDEDDEVDEEVADDDDDDDAAFVGVEFDWFCELLLLFGPRFDWFFLC